MQTLEQCYHQIAQDPDMWSYYSNPLSVDDAWYEDDEAYDFMKNYFICAGKGMVFEDDYLTSHKKDIVDRARHIISTYLLGIKIADCFGIDIYTRDPKNMDKRYYWFLACLYHDVGYAYENDHNRIIIDAVNRDGFDALRRICSIKYWDNSVFGTYNINVVEYYLKCRAIDPHREGPVLDHGIVGGLLLYDKLRKQFEAAWENRPIKEEKRESFHISYESKPLHLSEEHFSEYAKAADAIIAHNIWKDTFEGYLSTYPPTTTSSNLVINQEIEIDNSICFLLSLADTIEPLKKDKEKKGAITLFDVEISGLRDHRGFKLQMDERVFNDYYWDIKKLETWVKVEVDVNNTVTGKKEIQIRGK
jgi:hypothetical protein